MQFEEESSSTLAAEPVGASTRAIQINSKDAFEAYRINSDLCADYIERTLPTVASKLFAPKEYEPGSLRKLFAGLFTLLFIKIVFSNFFFYY